MPLNHSKVRLSLLVVAAVAMAIIGGYPHAQSYSMTTSDNDASFWAELAFWESVKDSGNPKELQAYIDNYPNGRFATLAKLRLAALEEPRGESTSNVKATKRPSTGKVLKIGDVFRDCDGCPQMKVIPPGRFKMGSDYHRPEERPSHVVVIPGPLAIGTHEITVEEWNACIQEGACSQVPQASKDGRLPVANVSWNDARDYLKWLTEKSGHRYRLPSEAEWEYAARAGTETAYWWGDKRDVKKANCRDCTNRNKPPSVTPTGDFAANPFGLYDVHGNLSEWTEDCWNPSYRGAPSNGEAWLAGDCLSRVLRGGSWALDHDYMRASRRSRYDRDVRYYQNGFRVVREIPPSASREKSQGLPSFEKAILTAGEKVFGGALKAQPNRRQREFLVDPLIDGLNGTQTLATRRFESLLLNLIGEKFQSYSFKPFSAANFSRTRLVSIGTFTGVNKQRKTRGIREAYRICLVLLDLQIGKVVSKAKVFSDTAAVDITPSAFFRESPAWTPDSVTQAYIRTCQATKPGDPIDPLYLQRIQVGTIISDGIGAYEKEEFQKSRDLFIRALKSPGGIQLRTLNGLYLTALKLGDLAQLVEATDRLISFGLDNGGLALKFPFRKGSTELDFELDKDQTQGQKLGLGKALSQIVRFDKESEKLTVNLPFDSDSGNSEEEDDTVQLDLWLLQLANEASRRQACLEVIGHTDDIGPESLNQRLAVRRAESIKLLLEGIAPEMVNRVIASGEGTRNNLVGSRSGDTKDALDRRMQFAVIQCAEE